MVKRVGPETRPPIKVNNLKMLAISLYAWRWLDLCIALDSVQSLSKNTMGSLWEMNHHHAVGPLTTVYQSKYEAHRRLSPVAVAARRHPAALFMPQIQTERRGRGTLCIV